GSAEVLEENNFYPFGLKHEGYNALTGNPAYNYEYNGKELQKETGWNDYGARMYMSDIGRWGVIDPLAEQYRRFTPYNYAANNPIMFIDPDGRKIQAPGRNGESLMTQYQPTTGMISYLGAGDRASVAAFLGLGDGMGLFYFRTDGGGSPKTFGETQEYRNAMAALGNNPSP
ncbi:RHS repeat-associated core domain-containing protein, partial [Chryseobacterium sp. OSA05B]|uniref:RHS repeat-associated core domain-containing protein n=1 Tax=Chryseobacterium sp. OSA05B TaxID=2862650 RepID=UPI001CBDAAB8